jgi:hypothetical protein
MQIEGLFTLGASDRASLSINISICGGGAVEVELIKHLINSSC